MNPQILSKINRGRGDPAPASIPWREIASTPERGDLIVDYVNREQLLQRKHCKKGQKGGNQHG